MVTLGGFFMLGNVSKMTSAAFSNMFRLTTRGSRKEEDKSTKTAIMNHFKNNAPPRKFLNL